MQQEHMCIATIRFREAMQICMCMLAMLAMHICCIHVHKQTHVCALSKAAAEHAL